MDADQSTQNEKTNAARQKNRESIFLSANLTFGSTLETMSVRVRNISSGGMMVDCILSGQIGEPVIADIKSIGRIKGHVAWAVAPRMGIAFDHEIDPKAARVKVETPYSVDDLMKAPTLTRRPGLAVR